MRRIVVIFILSSISYSVIGQKVKDKQFTIKPGLLDIQMGMAIPILDFGLDELTLPAGYAQPGYNIKLGMSYDLAPFLGLALQYQYCNNPFNTDKFLNDFKANNKTATIHSYTSNSWELKGMLIGIYYPFRTFNTSVDIRLLGGILTGVFPENELNYNEPAFNNQQLNIKQFETTATNIGFQAGIKLRHVLYKNLLLIGSADYTYTRINFTDIKTIETNYNIPLITPDYKQTFNIINLSAGLGIQF